MVRIPYVSFRLYIPSVSLPSSSPPSPRIVAARSLLLSPLAFTVGLPGCAVPLPLENWIEALKAVC